MAIALSLPEGLYNHESNALSERSESKGHNNILPYFVYILRTSSDTLYIGQTNDLQRRLKDHKAKNTKSAKYVQYFASFNIVYSETYKSKVEAMRREYQLKHWTKAKKEALIKM